MSKIRTTGITDKRRQTTPHAIREIPLRRLLPSTQDVQILRNEMLMMVRRILARHMPTATPVR